MKWIYYPMFFLWYTISLLPLKVLYGLSDYFIFPLCYYIIRYRRKMVHRHLDECFPERSETERRRIERDFYHYFCDYIVETLRMMSMSRAEMGRRVEWVGLDHLEQDALDHGKSFIFAYLGHLGNWEWLSSFSLHLKEFQGAQIYHPLRNKAFDELFRRMRQQFGGRCIAMKDTLRSILTSRRNGEKLLIGFISDQSPKWEAMHQWCTFLHHDTSFFIGTEKIGKQVDATILYVDVTRPRRGYYRAEIKMMTHDAKSMPDYTLTDRYAQLLEESIQRSPHLWLWTHNRWKRTKQRWEELRG